MVIYEPFERTTNYIGVLCRNIDKSKKTSKQALCTEYEIDSE